MLRSGHAVSSLHGVSNRISSKEERYYIFFPPRKQNSIRHWTGSQMWMLFVTEPLVISVQTI